MSRFEIKMPKLGESITEGTIISWSVKVGDTVQEDDVLFEVNTAKVSAEIPSPVEGKVIGILFKEGDTVPVGTVVAIVDIDSDEGIERLFLLNLQIVSYTFNLLYNRDLYRMLIK